MSVSTILIRVIGAIVALLGLALVLSALGISTGVHIPVAWWIEAVVGLLFIGVGAYIIRDGIITV